MALREAHELESVIRTLALVLTLLVASVSLGFGPVREPVVRRGLAAATAAAMAAPAARHAVLEHGPRGKSVWTLLRGHARADDELSRATSIWDDDDDTDDDDPGPLGAGSSQDDEDVAASTDLFEARPIRAPDGPDSDDGPTYGARARSLRPASGYTKTLDRPPLRVHA